MIKDIKDKVIKPSVFAIAAQNSSTKKIEFLNFCSRDEWSYWSELGYQTLSKEEAENRIISIRRDVKSQSGEYFNNKLDYSTLTLVEFGILNKTSIDIQAPTEKEKQILDLNSKLSPEEIEFIKKNM